MLENFYIEFELNSLNYVIDVMITKKLRKITKNYKNKFC